MQTLGIIESYYPSFTKSEKRIADFIIESNSKVIDLTLSELAVMLNVGEATIVRFCRKMKLKGFQELKFLPSGATAPAPPRWMTCITS